MICLLAGLISCQYDQGREGFHQGNQPSANILLHKQALGQDGSFNYAFAADNGLQQGEVINPDGSRKGSYSYVDPNGKTITLSYTAGKDGFKVLSGDHIPKGPEPQQQRPPHIYYPHTPQNHQYQHPLPQDPSHYPHFRSNPIPFEAYRNSPNAPAYRGNPAPHEEPNRRVPYRPLPLHQSEPLLYEGPNRPTPQTLAPQYQPRQYGVQEGNYEKHSPYIGQQFRGDYRQYDSKKPHSFGNGYSFEFAG